MKDIGSQPLIVNSYGFNIPCRRFLVAANVTRDRRLPVADEFVLRVLKICERVPVRRLGAFFGFGEMETETVVADLLSRGLIVVDGDTALLHPSAHEHFRGSVEKGARILTVEPWVDRLWFDLVSRNIMRPDRTRPIRNGIDIRPVGLARDLPFTFAQKAFEENSPNTFEK